MHNNYLYTVFGSNLDSLNYETTLPVPTLHLHQTHLQIIILSSLHKMLPQLYFHPSITPLFRVRRFPVHSYVFWLSPCAHKSMINSPYLPRYNLIPLPLFPFWIQTNGNLFTFVPTYNERGLSRLVLEPVVVWFASEDQVCCIVCVGRQQFATDFATDLKPAHTKKLRHLREPIRKMISWNQHCKKLLGGLV